MVTGTLGLGYTVPSFILVEPWWAEAAFKTDFTAFFIRKGEGAAGHVAGIPTLQVHLALWAAQSTEVWLPPPDVHAFSGTRSSVVSYCATQAILAVSAGANIITAVLQVGQRADCMVAGLELGGRQERASLLRKPGQAWVQAAGVAVLSVQVRTIPLKLPGVSEVYHQRLHQARRREEVVSLVAIVIPTQTTGLPRIDWGQLNQ